MPNYTHYYCNRVDYTLAKKSNRYYYKIYVKKDDDNYDVIYVKPSLVYNARDDYK